MIKEQLVYSARQFVAFFFFSRHRGKPTLLFSFWFVLVLTGSDTVAGSFIILELQTT